MADLALSILFSSGNSRRRLTMSMCPRLAALSKTLKPSS
eukprot:13359.XXX_355127_355243_1 [CDS] Oithona nana genome sequencing.